MYEIVLQTWYQETPKTSYHESYNNMEFEFIEDACEYLGKNYEAILNEYPVEQITIKYNLSKKK